MAANPASRYCKHCGEPINDRSRLEECPKCRARAVRWIGRPPAQILERRRKLNVWDHTLEDILPGDVDRLAAKPESQLLIKPPSHYRPTSKRTKEVVRLFELANKRRK
jgi:hypothetical protein